jgi:hypothetical protein
VVSGTLHLKQIGQNVRVAMDGSLDENPQSTFSIEVAILVM